MNFPVCWNLLSATTFVATLTLLICGCEPEAEIGKTIDAGGSPRAIVSPAAPETAAQPLPVGDASTKDVEEPEQESEDAANTDAAGEQKFEAQIFCWNCLLYTSPSPRDKRQSRMPSSA